MPSFFNLLAAAGNSAMPNTVNPMFMVVPNYVTSANGNDFAVYDVLTVAPDNYIFQIYKPVAQTGNTPVNLLTGSANGAPVISF